MERLYERVWEHSLKNSYGFKLHLETFRAVRFGFSVAFLEKQDSFGKESLKKVLHHAQNHHQIIGEWFNSENQQYYFDSVAIFRNLDQALEFARQNQQIAIFDLTNMIEIKVEE